MSKIKVVYSEPGQTAQIKHIDNSNESLRKIVKGGLDFSFPFIEQYCIICNDEGKYNGMKPNRAIYVNGKIVDVIFGPLVICAYTEESLESLPDNDAEKYLKLFNEPEMIYILDGEIVSIKIVENDNKVN